MDEDSYSITVRKQIVPHICTSKLTLQQYNYLLNSRTMHIHNVELISYAMRLLLPH